MAICLAAVLSVAPLVGGCPTGDGEGEVVGVFFLLGCDDAFDYGSVDAPVRYDMEANFFVGEPIVDELESHPTNRLDIRIQRGGNNIEDVDSLYFQIADVRQVAESFSATGYSGTSVGYGENVRALLSLFVTCPTFFGSLVATVDASAPACPDLDPVQRDELCDSLDYNSPLDPVATLGPFAPGSSCLIFCRFGSARRGEQVRPDFSINFGDVVQGLFYLTLVEQRLLESGQEICDDGRDNDGDGVADETDCTDSAAGGWLMGKFNFEVRRGQVAQEFP